MRKYIAFAVVDVLQRTHARCTRPATRRSGAPSGATAAHPAVGRLPPHSAVAEVSPTQPWRRAATM